MVVGVAIEAARLEMKGNEKKAICSPHMRDTSAWAHVRDTAQAEWVETWSRGKEARHDASQLRQQQGAAVGFPFASSNEQ